MYGFSDAGQTLFVWWPGGWIVGIPTTVFIAVTVGSILTLLLPLCLSSLCFFVCAGSFVLFVLFVEQYCMPNTVTSYWSVLEELLLLAFSIQCHFTSYLVYCLISGCLVLFLSLPSLNFLLPLQSRITFLKTVFVGPHFWLLGGGASCSPPEVWGLFFQPRWSVSSFAAFPLLDKNEMVGFQRRPLAGWGYIIWGVCSLQFIASFASSTMLRWIHCCSSFLGFLFQSLFFLCCLQYHLA